MTTSGTLKIQLHVCGLASPEPTIEHAGVWLERCFRPDQDKEKRARTTLYQRAVDAMRPKSASVVEYARSYDRWLRSLRQSTLTRREVVVEATSRVLLHPASNGSVTDGSVLMHHTYGVPYLPGSGLKGIAREWARKVTGTDGAQPHEGWRSDAQDNELVRALFGKIPRPIGEDEDSQASVIEFLDALWVPEAPRGSSPEWSALALDIVNPHHSGYYTKEGAPGDTEEPTPTHRLSVAPGARFMVVVESSVPGADRWLDFAIRDLLLPALREDGFGAWTSSGYGRFSAPGESPRTAGVAAKAPEWHEVTVRLDPGSGRLMADLPGERRRVAEVTNPQAQRLRATLPAEAQERLTKKRQLRLRVRVEPNGNAWWIVELSPAGT